MGANKAISLFGHLPDYYLKVRMPSRASAEHGTDTWRPFQSFSLVIAGIWPAGERRSAELGFLAKLGVWFVLLGRPVDRPGQLFAWWFWYDDYAPAIFIKAFATSSGIVGCAVAIIGSLSRVRQNRLVPTSRLMAPPVA